jgi:hypothetical protein
MLDVTKSLPEDFAELRAFTALLLAEVQSQAVLIAKLRLPDDTSTEKNQAQADPRSPSACGGRTCTGRR